LVKKKKQRFAEMDVARKLKRRERELDELGKLISDIAKFAEELHKSVNEDMGNVLKNEEANKELKEFLVIILILYF
jgi:sugar-specific transcriptional regulator TrmB